MKQKLIIFDFYRTLYDPKTGSLTQTGWALGDILVTLTEDLPVHGKRECVMIPGKII